MKTDHSILSVYLDGELDSPWKEKLDQRLASDPQLQKELENLQRVKSALAQLPEKNWEESQSRSWEKIQGRLKVRAKPLVQRKVIFTIPLAAAAAMALVAGSLLTGFVWGTSHTAAGSLELASKKLTPQEIMVLIEKANAAPEAQLKLPAQYNLEVKNEGRLLRMTTFQQETP